MTKDFVIRSRVLGGYYSLVPRSLESYRKAALVPPAMAAGGARASSLSGNLHIICSHFCLRSSIIIIFVLFDKGEPSSMKNFKV